MILFLYSIYEAYSTVSTIINVVGWTIYLLVVNFIVMHTYGKTHPQKFWASLMSAGIGTAIGMVFNHVCGIDNSPFGLWGIIIGVIGTVAFLIGHDRYTKRA